MAGGPVIFSVSSCYFPFAETLWLFVAARAVLGLAEGAFMPAARKVVLAWSPDRPGEVLGRVFAASVGGFALGPLVGALLAARFGLRAPFLVPAVVLAAAIPVVARIRVPPTDATTSHRRTPQLRMLLGSRLVVGGIAFGAIDFLTVGTSDAVWALMLNDQGAGIVLIGISFLLIALPTVLFAARFGRLADSRSTLLVAFLGVAIIIAAHAGHALLAAPALLLASAFVQGLGTAAIAPVGASLVAAGSPPDLIARGQGLLEAAGFLVAAAAAFASGWVYDAAGRRVLWGAVATLTVLLAAGGWMTGLRSRSAPASGDS